jgi:hypothetical protein
MAIYPVGPIPTNVFPCGPRKEKPKGEQEVSRQLEVVEVAPPPISEKLKKRWSNFIRKVYETDPPTCPSAGGRCRSVLLTCLRATQATLRSMGRISRAVGQKPRKKRDHL